MNGERKGGLGGNSAYAHVLGPPSCVEARSQSCTALAQPHDAHAAAVAGVAKGHKGCAGGAQGQAGVVGAPLAETPGLAAQRQPVFIGIAVPGAAAATL